MTRILVTGAAGRVGSALVGELVAAGYEVRQMTRPGGRRVAPSVPEIGVVEASLESREALAAAVEGVDVIVHLAAQLVMGETITAEQYFDVNTTGTLRLLESAVTACHPVRKFVFTSTDGVYGPACPQSDVIDETHPTVPGDYYGMTKILAENLVRNYAKLHDLDVAILRLGSVIAPLETVDLFRAGWTRSFLGYHLGAGRRGNLWPVFEGHGDLVKTLDTALQGRRDDPALALTGPDSLPWRIHFTDVRDVVSAIVLTLQAGTTTPEPMNVVGPHSTPFPEGAGAVAERHGLDLVEVQLPTKISFGLSYAKATREIGYRPQWSFRDTVNSAPRQG